MQEIKGGLVLASLAGTALGFTGLLVAASEQEIAEQKAKKTGAPIPDQSGRLWLFGGLLALGVTAGIVAFFVND